MGISFSQFIPNTMVVSKFLFQLKLKCQCKNYPCLLEKAILNYEMTEL